MHAEAEPGALAHRGIDTHLPAILEKNGVSVELLRPVDYTIAPGVYPDMREHGWERDDWPGILDKVLAADILVIGSSIWLGDKTSVATQVIERLYSASHHLNAAGQYAYYGRVGGCLITGNEDGAKHCAMNILYSLQHLGYVIPPQADAAWLGLPCTHIIRSGQLQHAPAVQCGSRWLRWTFVRNRAT